MTITCSKEELPLIKKLKAIGDRHEGTIKIAVHSGRFHADELIALAILKEALPEYNFQVMRTRKHSELVRADITIDVGGGEFDHHHDIKRYGNGVPMAACGKILEAVESSKPMINILNRMGLYAVQAIDNGERISIPRECTTNLFDWVSSFNPTFEERTPSDGEYYDRFFEAFGIVRRIYRRMRALARAQLNAETVLRNAPSHVNGQFLELPTGGVPWFHYLMEKKDLLGVLYPDVSDGTWKVMVAPTYPGSRENKVYFPSSWGGQENTILETISGIKGATFCHLGLHLAGFKTKESALVAARTLSEIYRMNAHA